QSAVSWNTSVIIKDKSRAINDVGFSFYYRLNDLRYLIRVMLPVSVNYYQDICPTIFCVLKGVFDTRSFPQILFMDYYLGTCHLCNFFGLIPGAIVDNNNL